MIVVKDSDNFQPKVNGNVVRLNIEKYTQIYLYIHMTGSGTGFSLKCRIRDNKYISDRNFYEVYIYDNSLIPFSINVNSSLNNKRFIIPLIFPLSCDEVELIFEWTTTEHDLNIFINSENVYA